MPGLSTAYRAPLLTNVMVRYRNMDFIAEQVFPTLPVDKELDYVFVFDKENLRAPKNTARGLYDRAERVDYGLKQVALPPLIERALEQQVPWKLQRQAQTPYQPMISATNNTTEKIAIEKEIALATYLANSSNVPNNTTLSGTAQWSDYTDAASHPLNDVQTAHTTVLLQSTRKANTAVMGRLVYDKFINHPDIIDRLKYTQSTFAMTVDAALARLLQVDKVCIGEAVYNNTQPNITDSMAYIWGKHFWLMYVASLPALEEPSAGYHLIIPEERYVDSWTEQPKKSDFIRVNDYYTRYTFATEAIYAIYNAVA